MTSVETPSSPGGDNSEPLLSSPLLPPLSSPPRSSPPPLPSPGLDPASESSEPSRPATPTGQVGQASEYLIHQPQAVNSTPISLGVGAYINTRHTVDNIYPPLQKHEMEEYTHFLPLERWVNDILGQSPAQIRAWESMFHNEGLFMDTTIREAVTEYLRLDCNNDEHGLYEPFCLVANRILELYRKSAQNADPFPVDDLLFCRNDPVPIGAHRNGDRSPDVVLITRTVLELVKSRQTTKKCRSTTGIQWMDLFSIFEFRTSQSDLYRDESVKEWCKRQNMTQEQFKGTRKMRYPKLILSKVKSALAETLIPAHRMSQQIPGPSQFRPPNRGAASELLPTEAKKRRIEDEGDEDSHDSEPQGEPEANRPQSPIPEPSFKIPIHYEKKMASYALEMLSCTNGTRSSFFQCLIAGDIVRFHYSDSTGIVWSTQFSWVRKLEKFAAILVAIAYCDHERFGMTVPGLTPPVVNPPRSLSIPPVSLEGYSLNMEYMGMKVRVTLGAPIYIQYSLVGRNTCIYSATTSVAIPGCPKLVIKISMQFLTREHEVEFLLRARQQDIVDHLPTPHMWSNAETSWRSSEGVWGLMFPDNADTRRYEPRRQDIIVLTRYTPLEEVLTPENMYSLFNQLFEVLYRLRYQAYILHRDISLNNLMVELINQDGMQIFRLILIDIDLGVLLDEDGSPTGERSRHRTGTLPFMALDLLHTPDGPHYLRYDFESAFYVVLWLVVKSKNVFLNWENTDIEQVINAKSVLWGAPRNLCHYIERDFRLLDRYSAYKPWILAVWGIFAKGMNASASRDAEMQLGFEVEDFDVETLGGNITYDKLKDAVTRLRPMLTERIPGLL